MKLTEHQRVMLAHASAGPVNPWSYGSTTVSRLKKLGYIEKDPVSGCVTQYTITTAGIAALNDPTG